MLRPLATTALLTCAMAGLPSLAQTQNLIPNGSFEDNGGPTCGQASLLPAPWFGASYYYTFTGADTYTFDCSQAGGLDSGFYLTNNFNSLTAAHDGIRFSAGADILGGLGAEEAYGVPLTTALSPGATYSLSGYFTRADRPDITNPGELQVWLSTSTDWLADGVPVGSLGGNAIHGTWTPDQLSFVAPIAASHIVFVPKSLGPWYSYLGSDSWELVAANLPPVADAGTDQVVDEGALVTLDGTGSNDPNGDSLTFAWTQVGGSAVVLSDATTPQPTFVAPWVAVGGETLSFQLVVDDGALASAADVVNVTVKNVNHPPVADAGVDQAAAEGSLVTLDGTASYDEDGEPLAFVWSQVSGTPVVLSSSTVATPSFTAPPVGVAGEVLTFELVVGDGIDVSTPDQVQVAVTNVNNAPTADAGPPQTVAEGTTVLLDGSGSSDPDGDPLGYSWSQVSGPAVTLSDPSAVAPSFTAPDVIGSVDLVFSLSVFDSNGATAPLLSTTTITVRDGSAPPDCQNARPSVAELWPPNHKMVEVTIEGVTDPDDQVIQITVTGVAQDEPTTGQGKGDSGPDAVLQGDRVLLRAERTGGGNGRVYHVSFVASDGAGGQCSGTVQVIVPHDRRGGAVDDGPLHDATR